jgi:hypothetical protein
MIGSLAFNTNTDSFLPPPPHPTPLTPMSQEHIRRKTSGLGPTSTAYVMGEGWGANVALAAAAQCP